MPDHRETIQYLEQVLEERKKTIRAQFGDSRGIELAEYHRGRMDELDFVLGAIYWQTTKGWEKVEGKKKPTD